MDPINDDPDPLDAHFVYNRIQEHISDDALRLEVGQDLLVIVPLPDGSRVIVQTLAYDDPNFIVVFGEDSLTRVSVHALVPHTSIHVLISTIAIDQKEPRREIGFRGSAS